MNITSNTSGFTFRIAFSIIVIIVCYIGACYAIFDITHNYFLTPVLAALSCLDFIIAYVVLRRSTMEPSNVWYTFAAIFLIAAFASTLVWWALGVLGASKLFSVFGAAMVLLLRVIVINVIGGDEQNGLLI